MEEIEAMEKKCDQLENTEKAIGFVITVVDGIGSIPLVGDAIGAFTSGITAVSNVIAGTMGLSDLAKGCSSLSFDKMETIMDKHFKEINKKMDQQMSALSQVANMVQESLLTIENLRHEMHQRFEQVLASNSNSKLLPLVSQINGIIKFFNFEKELLLSLSQKNLISKLEEPDSILLFLQRFRTSASESLHVPLMEIINQRFAIPSHEQDEVAFKSLDFLIDGVENYLAIFYFILDQHYRLANHYYAENELEKFNANLDRFINTFNFFKTSFVGSRLSRKSEHVIQRTILNLKQVRQLDFIRVKKIELYGYLNTKIAHFTKDKEKIENLKLPFIEETPEKFTGVTFPNSIATPIGLWEPKKQVQYAVQYVTHKGFSRVGTWSTPFEVRENACPMLHIPVDDQRKNRLVFRKFLGEKAEFVGALDPYETKFSDINRDLYNAALSVHIKTALNEANILLKAGAKINATLDRGRTAMHAAAQSGNVELAIRFLREHNADVNVVDQDGNTPLHVAAEHGQDEFIKMLIQHRADVNAKTRKYELVPLHLCARKGFDKSVEALLASPGIDVNARDISGYTPMHVAALGGTKTIELLVSHPSIEHNPKSKLGFTPLHMIAVNNDVLAAQALMNSRKISVNEGDNQGLTPLHHAALMGNTEMVQYIASLSEIDVNAKEKQKRYTPLHVAILMKKDESSLALLTSRNIDMETDCESSPLHVSVSFGRDKVVKELLKNQSLQLEKKTKEGYTALHYAAMLKNSNILMFLLGARANIEAQTDDGSTPLHIAVKVGSIDNIISLIQRRANISAINSNGHSVLHEALEYNDFNIIRLLINMYPPLVEIKNKYKETPILVASRKSQLAIAKHLISKRCNINVQNVSGMSPLLYFASSGNLEMIKILINKGADPYAADIQGKTFLYHAIENGHLPVVMYAMSTTEFDLSKVVNVGAERNMLCTAVDLAIKKKHFPIMKFFADTEKINECDPMQTASYYGSLRFIKHLVESLSYDVNKVSKYGETALCRACVAGQVDIVRYLLMKRADVGQKCLMAFSPVHFAILNDHLDILKILFKNGVNLDTTDPMKSRPLYLATYMQNVPIVKFILERHTNDLNAANQVLDVPVHTAARQGNLEILKILVEKKARLDVQDINRDTPLHLAARKGYLEMVKYLVEKGADVSAKNNLSQTPLDVAGNGKVKEFLQSRRGRRHYDNYVTSSNDLLYIPPAIDWKRSQLGIENKNSAPANNMSSKEGSLLLLDVLIRKLTKQKYINAPDSPNQKNNATVRALQLIKNLETQFNSAYKIPGKKQVNFFELFSSVHKAIRNKQENKLHEIVHSFINEALENGLIAKETAEKLLIDA